MIDPIYQPDFVYKIVIVGDSGVGKTSLLLRYVENDFDQNYISTVGVDFKFKIIRASNEHNRPIYIKLHIWDTAGQERFRAVTKSFYRDAVGVLCVFDLTDYETFRACEKWIQEVENSCEQKPMLILIGNKSDYLEMREVSYDEADNYAKNRGIPYVETSARTGDQVKLIFEKITQEIYNRWPDSFFDEGGKHLGIVRKYDEVFQPCEEEDKWKDKCCK